MSRVECGFRQLVSKTEMSLFVSVPNEILLQTLMAACTVHCQYNVRLSPF